MNYWENIIKDIGYDPKDETSFYSDEKEMKKQKNAFWNTYRSHLKLLTNYDEGHSQETLKRKINEYEKFIEEYYDVGVRETIYFFVFYLQPTDNQILWQEQHSLVEEDDYTHRGRTGKQRRMRMRDGMLFPQQKRQAV